MMDVGDAPHQRIFHRNDAEVAIAGFHRLDGVLEAGLGNCQGMFHGLARRQIGIGPRLTLKGDALGVSNDLNHEAFFRSLLARSRSAGVSTDKGTLSTRVTAMLIFASSALSCSSFSRNSSGDCGRATKRASAARV